MESYDLGSLVGCQVRRITFDDRVRLMLLDGSDVRVPIRAELVIEAAIAYRDPDGNDREIRPGITASLAPMLELLRCRLTAASFDGRELTVSLDDGSQFTVFTGERYEAWALKGEGVPNLVAGPWSLSDGAAGAREDQTGPEDSETPWSEVGLPAYGLSPAFRGRRTSGLWDRMMGEQFVGVLLDHGGADAGFLVTVGTIAKSSPLIRGREDLAGVRVTGFEAALSQALYGLLQLEMPPYGEERSGYLREKLPEMDQLALDLASPAWERTMMKVAGVDREAHVHRSGRSWAVAIDLDDRLGLALWGRGIEPSEIELVEVDELDDYPWPAGDIQ